MADDTAMRLRTLIMAILVAAAIVPAARSEDPPGDRTGRPSLEQAKDRAREHGERAKERAREHSERAKERAERTKQRAERARAKAQKERLERRGDAKREARCGELLAMGDVLEVGEDSVLVDVARSNHAKLRGHEVRFVVKEKTGFKGAEGLADLGEGDSVLIHGRACKEGEKVHFLAGRVEVKERAAPDSEEEAEDEESEEESDEESDEESEEEPEESDE
jgi:hypothetical protein